MRRLAIPCVAAVALLLSLLSAVASAKPVLGIADNQPASYADVRLRELGLSHARINVPWDVLSDASSLPGVDAWMAATKAAGMRPLVSFDRSRRPGRAGLNPSPAQLAGALRAWRARWPGQVTEVSAWNEPNINGKSPKRVAAWWTALRRACSACTVLPGELVDRKNAVTWARAFVKAARRTPAVWALHAYVDANNFSTASTAGFLKAVKGRVWLTETGGVVARKKPLSKFAGRGVDFQTQVTDYLLNRLVRVSPRIQRLYLYSWGSGAGPLTWDSGLVAPDGQARPALNVVRRYLGLAPVTVSEPGARYRRPKPAKPAKPAKPGRSNGNGKAKGSGKGARKR